MKGFTLIELIIAVSIALLLAGFVLVNYNTYADTQKLKQAALTLKNNLRFAHSRATSGKKPANGCTELVGFRATFTGSSYSIQAVCTEGLAGDATVTVLPAGVTFSPTPSNITFGVLTQGLLGGDGITITLTGSSKIYAIAVSVNGDMNDLGFQ